MRISVEHLGKSYHGTPVLRDVTFTAGPGITCVMAPSGVGKTTLLRLLLGLETPDEGSVRLPENCRWAAVFQEDRLLEHLDAWGNLHLIGTRQGEARAAAMLAELGLAETAERPVREYSGGMRRRLALDEPFSGLVDDNRAVCRAVLQRETVGKPVLLVTHDEDDAAGLDARIIRLAPAR